MNLPEAKILLGVEVHIFVLLQSFFTSDGKSWCDTTLFCNHNGSSGGGQKQCCPKHFGWPISCLPRGAAITTQNQTPRGSWSRKAKTAYPGAFSTFPCRNSVLLGGGGGTKAGANTEHALGYEDDRGAHLSATEWETVQPGDESNGLHPRFPSSVWVEPKSSGRACLQYTTPM